MSTIYRLQFLFIAAAAILAAVCPANAQTTQAPNTPGPSARLFAAPFYRCARNFYVDATYGNDANAGTEDAPWQNIQTADATVQAGDCVNVQPGNYGSGAYITQGGNAPRPRGYVVYRCSQLDACKITGGGGPGGTLLISGPNGVGPGFVVIDGFEITVNSQDTYGMGIQVSDTGDFRTAPGAHHIWLLNNIIHGNGQAGINASMGEFCYFLHNETYDNARVTCDAQGSGIAIVVPSPVPNYAPSGMDLTYAQPFRNVVAFNVSHNNALTQCGSATNMYDTDGNGIIMDTFVNDITGVTYPYQTLVAFNIAYNNGGGGIHIFNSSNVTVANNTAFNNQIDPFNSGSPRTQIDTNGGDNNTFINNIAYGFPAITASDPRCEGTQPCTLTSIGAFLAGRGDPSHTDNNNTFYNNISFIPGSSNGSENDWFDTDSIESTIFCNNNKCSIDPLFVTPSDVSSPAYTDYSFGNFALQAESPALGYAQTPPYLPWWTMDAGACDSRFEACP